MEITIGSEWIIQVAAAVLSLAMSYIPGLRTWFAAQSQEFKSLFMAGVLLLVTGGVFGLGCAGWLETNLVCNSEGIKSAVFMLFLAIATNQGIYNVSPQTQDVKTAKELR